MPPRHLTLHEYRTLPAVALSLEQASALHKWVRDLAVAPSYARPGCFDLTPGSWIGTAVLDDLTIEVLPKIPLDRVLFMVSYALDRVDLGREVYAYAERSSLVELLASLFAACVREASAVGYSTGIGSRRSLY